MRFKRYCRNCDCEQEIVPVLGYWEHWRKLFWLLEYLNLEGEISDETYNEYVESLIHLKGLAMDADERLEKNDDQGSALKVDEQ